jgi:hypothetical protein
VRSSKEKLGVAQNGELYYTYIMTLYVMFGFFILESFDKWLQVGWQFEHIILFSGSNFSNTQREPIARQ